jgi:formylglycine-generating enzyme required for sulfatase activity
LYWAKAHDQPYEALEAYWLYKLGIREPVLPTRVAIPRGTFLMGSSPHEAGHDESEGPQREVTVKPFAIGATEVTFEEYGAFCDATGRALPGDAGWGKATRPVINVDWNDAHAYAQWLDAMTGWGCRLPSEAEWEYAARAGTKTAYALPAPDGSDDIAGKDLANCRDCGSEWDESKTAPVRSFEPNALGLYDMHGNVWEWVEDCWHETYDGAPEDSRAWLEADEGDSCLRVLRGGSWYHNRVFARAAFRYRYSPDYRNYFLGFRVVCLSPSLDTDR